MAAAADVTRLYPALVFPAVAAAYGDPTRGDCRTTYRSGFPGTAEQRAETPSMAQYLVAYGATAAAFLVVDLVWLGVVAKSFYRDRIGALMADDVNLAAALVFYALYIVGIVVFAVSPALQTGSVRSALFYGAVLGLVAYGTYDLTNLATLREWPVVVTVVDMAWGTVLTAVSALAGFLAARFLG